MLPGKEQIKKIAVEPAFINNNKYVGKGEWNGKDSSYCNWRKLFN